MILFNKRKNTLEGMSKLKHRQKEHYGNPYLMALN